MTSCAVGFVVNTVTTMSDAKKSKAAPKVVPTVSKVLEAGEILELIYQPDQGRTVFSVWDGSAAKEVNDYRMPDGTKLVPYSPKNNLIAHDVVLFPSGPEEYGTEERLVDEIDYFIGRYMALSPEFRHIAAYYVLLTWIYDQFNELPYLRVRGDYGSGKTRFLLTIGSLCYKPIFASGASSVSPIFRLIDSFGGTLLVDEADFRFSDEKSEMVKILNNGNVRGFPVLRSEQSKTNEYNPTAFRVFGPKLIATRGYYEDRALESRFITEELGGRPLGSDIPINLPSCYQDEARTLRNKLLLYRFRTLGKKKIQSAALGATLEPRFKQIYTPLASVMGGERERENLAILAKRAQDAVTAERSDDVEAQVLTVIAALRESETTPSVKIITDRFAFEYGSQHDRRVTPKWIGSIIRRNLKISTYKSHGKYVINTKDNQLLEHLYERYGVGSGDMGTSAGGASGGAQGKI